MACDNFLYFGTWTRSTDGKTAGTGVPGPAASLIGPLKIEGETIDPGHKDALEIKEFSFGVENPTTIGSMSGGAGAGKAKFNEFNVKKAIDKASPVLLAACGMGCHFPTVTLSIRKAGGTKLDYLTYTFLMVFVTKIDWSGGAGEEAPDEDVTFVYGAMKIEYIPQLKDGSPGVVVPMAWSVVTNQPELSVGAAAS
jgi:type VI secretion system secreted protein Hcp